MLVKKQQKGCSEYSTITWAAEDRICKIRCTHFV